MKTSLKISFLIFGISVFLLSCTMIVPFSKNKIILMNCENGTLKAEHSYDEKLQKEIVTITAVPEENYKCSSISVVDAKGKTDKISDFKEISENAVSFSIDEDTVYVTAIFVQIVPDYPLYKIKTVYNDSTFCSLNPSAIEFKEGATVTFTNYSRSPKMKIADGFPKVYKNNGDPIEIITGEDNKTFSFLMPACDVVIESKIEWIYYPIVLKEITGGLINIQTEAHEDEDVVFTLIPDEGKVVKTNSVVVFQKGTPPILISSVCSTENALEYSFRMPAGQVFVYAEFE